MARTRLDPLLAVAGIGTALWLQGAPGEGKSTLIADYLRRADRSTLWYRIDELDEDPGSLFDGLDQALSLHGWVRHGEICYSSEWRSEMPRFAARWASERAHGVAGLCVVFDNLTRTTSEVLDRALAEITSEWVEVATCFITSHTLPRRSWITLLARSRLVVKSSESLRFSEVEAQELLAVDNAQPAAGYAARIVALTGGWAAGLAIASSLPPDFFDTNSASGSAEQGVFDFFVAHVLDRFDRDERQVVESTILLPWVTPVLARDVSAVPDAAEILEHLIQSGLFVERVAGDQTIYQYHEVLRGAVLASLPRGPNRAGIATTSVAVLIRTGALHEALALAFDELEPMQAAACLDDAACQLFSTGRETVLLAFGKRIDPAVLEGRPRLLLRLILAAAALDDPCGRHWLETAWRSCNERNDQVAMATVAAVALCVYQLGTLTARDVKTWHQAFISLYPLAAMSASGMEFTLIRAAALIASSFEEQDHGVFAYERWFDDFEREVLAGLDGPDPLDCQTYLVAAAGVFDYLRLKVPSRSRGEAFVRGVRESAAFSRASASFQCDWLTQESDFLHHAGRRQSQATVIAALMAMASQLPPGGKQVEVRYQAGLFALAEGLPERAIELANEAVAMAVAGASRSLPKALKLYGRCLLRLERWEDALLSSRRAIDAARSAGFFESWVCAFAMEGFCAMLALEQWADARDMARRQIENLAGVNRTTWEIHAQAVDALEQLSLGSDANVELCAVFRAMRLADLPGLLAAVPFLASRLAAAALDVGAETDYVKSLIRQRDLAPPPGAGPTWPWTIRIQMLRGFEVIVRERLLVFKGKSPRKPLELLRLLAVSPRMRSSPAALIEALWEEGVGDGRHKLEMTVARLRDVLGVADAISIEGGWVCLNPELVSCDVPWARQAVRHIADLVLGGRRLVQPDSDYGRALSLAPDFSPGLDESPAVHAAVQAYAHEWMDMSAALARYLRENGAPGLAVRLLEEVLKREPAAERFYLELMRTQIAAQRPNDALETFRRCKQMLSIVLGRAPSQEVLQLRTQLEG